MGLVTGVLLLHFTFANLSTLYPSLATCGVLVSEKVAAEMELPLTMVRAGAEGDLDPRRVKRESVGPRIQTFRVRLEMTGVNREQADQLVEAIESRCPIYRTLKRAAPTAVEVVLK